MELYQTSEPFAIIIILIIPEESWFCSLNFDLCSATTKSIVNFRNYPQKAKYATVQCLFLIWSLIIQSPAHSSCTMTQVYYSIFSIRFILLTRLFKFLHSHLSILIMLGCSNKVVYSHHSAFALGSSNFHITFGISLLCILGSALNFVSSFVP